MTRSQWINTCMSLSRCNLGHSTTRCRKLCCLRLLCTHAQIEAYSFCTGIVVSLQRLTMFCNVPPTTMPYMWLQEGFVPPPLHNSGVSPRQIACQLPWKRGTVSRSVWRYKQSRFYLGHPRPGRHQAMTTRNDTNVRVKSAEMIWKPGES